MQSCPAGRRILVVDDHAAVRNGVAELVSHGGRYCVGAEAESAEGALELLDGAEFDLALVDVSLPGLSGITLTRFLRGRHGRLPVVVLSMHKESLNGPDAARAGASGYVTKSEATERLLPAIESVLGGRPYFEAPTMERALLPARQEMETLPEWGAGCAAVRGYWTYTLSTRHLEWSPAMYKVCGFDTAVRAPHRDELTRRLRSGERAAAERAMDECIRLGRPFELTLRMDALPGERRVRIAGTALRDAEGLVHQVHGMAAIDLSSERGPTPFLRG